MKNFTLLVLMLSSLSLAQAQIMFEEEISIEDYAPLEVILPPSPLTVSPIFIGGYDIVQTTSTYGNPAGRAIAKEWHDFIGWTPDETNESMGWVTVNHEMIYNNDRIGDGGGMTAFRVRTNDDNELEVMEQTLDDGRTGHFFNVDFVNTVGETGMNCAGISAPNGRIWTAEEWYRSNTNSIHRGNISTSSLPIRVGGIRDGYGVRDTSLFTINAPEFTDVPVDGIEIEKFRNFNYMVEIDPKQAKAIRKQYNWGRGGWEGGAITNDGMYVYLGEDLSPAPFIRIKASTPWDFVNGITVEVYKQNNAQGSRWIAIDRSVENIFDDISLVAWEAGATMFMRNEWVAIDQETGFVYWTATGRDNAGSRFAGVNDVFPDAVTTTQADAYAQSIGFTSALDSNYTDPYGRVYYYNPNTEEIGVAINGGPFFPEDDSPAQEDYPEKHLSNPDGLNIIDIQGEKFLMICEDLNGTDFGRTPDGISNRLCELYLLSIDKVMTGTASIDDLIRITAIPRGAEITGAIQISPDMILVNSQHPNAQNPFPYNHSLTMVISGFSDIPSSLEGPNDEDLEEMRIYPNPTTRSVHLPSPMDFAIYDSQGRRVKVFRNTSEALVDDLAAGVYYIITEDQQSFKLVVE